MRALPRDSVAGTRPPPCPLISHCLPALILNSFNSTMMRLSGTLLRGLLQAEAKYSNRCGSAALIAVRAFADDASLLKTPLYEYHVANGGEGLRPRRRSRPPRPPATRKRSCLLYHEESGS